MRHAVVRVSFRSLMVQRDQWDTYWGPKKIIFLIREIDDAAMAAASMESCRFVVLRCPGGRLGSVVDVRNRRRRVCGRFHRWIQISTGPQQCADNYHDPPKFSIQSSVGSTKHRRMRPRGPPDPRSIPERVRAPIYIRKKCAIWTRWRPVPDKNVNYPRPPRNRNSGLVGPHTTPAIVNYKYMTSTPREGYFGPTTSGT